MSTHAHSAVMRLFREQAVTISKSGNSVLINCENGSDASVVFEWLTSITGKYGSVDDWLNEIESFSLRGERLLDGSKDIKQWLCAAFDAGCSRQQNEK